MLTTISWVAAAGVVAAYALLVTGRITPHQFNWANFLLFVPVALPGAIVGAWSSISVTVAFGVIGGVGVAREWQRKRPLNMRRFSGLNVVEDERVPDGEVWLVPHGMTVEDLL